MFSIYFSIFFSVFLDVNLDVILDVLSNLCFVVWTFCPFHVLSIHVLSLTLFLSMYDFHSLSIQDFS